jgi:two-component system sensor histidine kinase HydH
MNAGADQVGRYDIPGPSRPALRWLTPVLMVVVLTVAHFVAPPTHPWIHEFLFKVTYLPIVLAALWFGWRGGFLLALLTGLIYVVHIRWQLAGHHIHSQTSMVLELVLYLLIGLVVGWLADRQRRTQDRLAVANEELQQSFASLREKTQALLEAEESLRRADRLKAAGEIASGLAHEVRNPLGGIVGAAEILAKPETEAQAKSEFAAVLTRETKRLDGVISRFLDFARPAASSKGSSKLRMEIDFVERLTEGPRGKKRVAYNGQHVPEDLTVAMASDPLRQVILNLTLNALSAAPSDSGAITWKAAKDGDQIRAWISDNGTGIDPAIRDRLFAPFVATRGGTGLGLPIVARLLEEIGGTIEIEQTDGSGTTFVLSFPAASEDSQTSESGA